MEIKNAIYTFDEVKEIYSKYITSKDSLDLIEKAYKFADKKHEGQLRKSGDPYVSHVLGVAQILSTLNAGPSTIVAGLLHDTIEDTSTTKEEIEKEFGPDIAYLVESLTKITRLSDYKNTDFQAEDHRKIFVAMANDIRVIIIKLADRLHNMRTLQFQPETKQKRIANETLEVYAPIAHRLGISSIKTELEDLSLYYLDKEAFLAIEKEMNDEYEDLYTSINHIKDRLIEILSATSIKYEISSRVKSIYSIYKKMYLKHKKFEDIYDIMALRIITETETNCYEVLGHIHSAFRPVPGRFKDYIAMPKPNMYQSLHTTILSGDGHVFEIQIRTKDMDETAEGGVAAHWRYKEGISYDPKREQKEIESQLHWFKDFIAMTDEQANNETAKDYVDSLQHDIFDANVYVFTPKGKVISLPNGSTPIDFAYRIHTKVGDTLAGAKVNNKLVPLSTVLKTGDMVEIKTSDNASPNTEWLNIAKSSFARSHIRKYLAKQNTEFIRMDQIEKGKASLRDSLKERKLTLGFEKLNDKKLLSLLKLSSVDDLFIAINSKNIIPQQIIDYFELESKVEFDFNKDINKKEQRLNEAKNNVDSVLLADGSSAMISLASCCTPIPGDDIVGYITKGNGIKVHRKDCPNIKNEKARLIDVVWNYNVEKKKYPVDFQVDCTDRPNLLVDIMNAVNSIGASLININAKFHSHTNTTTISCTVLIYDNDTLEKLFQNIRQIKSVIELHRVQH
ncbi:MAG: bifunctional (p)ppGpp synthetase/guanosine-3',5'-bis(diphosphate) 3'-pyrophosphohydrolase [Bacilli bacterium]|nr:bifunctional (p)ppGpp synthetase/guanosine-3',5'-bis(diphosphate) 3'-pyrophosphohydrolase [Bacilli bacterium]